MANAIKLTKEEIQNNEIKCLEDIHQRGLGNRLRGMLFCPQKRWLSLMAD